MKRIGEPYSVTAPNGWGHDSTCFHTPYEVETEDVGRTRDNYLGYKHRSLVFKQSDVGRQLIVMTDGSGWT